MPNDTKTRSTYTTAQFLDAYKNWIAELGGSTSAQLIIAKLNEGETISMDEFPKYTRARFNELFRQAHNADMVARFGENDGEAKGIDEGYVDNTKLSQIRNYVKSSLKKKGYDVAKLLPLPRVSAGRASRDWDVVAEGLGLI
jgi:hypothetical protein